MIRRLFREQWHFSFLGNDSTSKDLFFHSVQSLPGWFLFCCPCDFILFFLVCGDFCFWAWRGAVFFFFCFTKEVIYFHVWKTLWSAFWNILWNVVTLPNEWQNATKECEKHFHIKILKNTLQLWKAERKTKHQKNAFFAVSLHQIS